MDVSCMNTLHVDILNVDYNVLFFFGLGKGGQHGWQGEQCCSICQGIMPRGSTKFLLSLKITYKHNKIVRSQVILPYIIVNCLHLEFYILQAGQQMKDKTQGACDAVKDKVGANKWKSYWTSSFEQALPIKFCAY